MVIFTKFKIIFQTTNPAIKLQKFHSKKNYCNKIVNIWIKLIGIFFNFKIIIICINIIYIRLHYNFEFKKNRNIGSMHCEIWCTEIKGVKPLKNCLYFF